MAGKSWLRGWSFALAASLALVACNVGVTDVPNATAFFPLRVGSAWSYRRLDETLGDPMLFGPVKPDSDFTVRVVRDTVDAAGTRWYAMENAKKLFPGTSSSYFGNSTAGLLTLTVFPVLLGQQFGQSSVVLFYPVTLGKVGQFGTVTAVDTAIVVPAGTFKCVRYDDSDPSIPGSFSFVAVFIAPQVGLVKRIAFNDTYFVASQHVTAQRSRVDCSWRTNPSLPKRCVTFA